MKAFALEISVRDYTPQDLRGSERTVTPKKPQVIHSRPPHLVTRYVPHPEPLDCGASGSRTGGVRVTRQRLNAQEAAEALGISVDAVRMRAWRGTLDSELENGRLHVWL